MMQILEENKRKTNSSASRHRISKRNSENETLIHLTKLKNELKKLKYAKEFLSEIISSYLKSLRT